MASIPNAIEQSQNLKAAEINHVSGVRLHNFVITVTGEYEPQIVEQWIRANAVVRERSREPEDRSPGLSTFAPHLSPRFARACCSSGKDAVWLFSWPISPLDETHERTLVAIAQLLERRLNRSAIRASGGVATCNLQVGRGFGSFIVEIRSTLPLEMDTVEKWVFSTIDQMREPNINPGEWRQVLEQIASPSNEFTQSALERASRATQRAFFPKSAQTATKLAHVPTAQPNISQLVRRDLSRNNVAEIVTEAIAPRINGKSPTMGPNPAQNSSREKNRNLAFAGHQRWRATDRRIYIMQKGESLQMIAQRYRVTTVDIIRANGLQHPDQIRPGKVLVIPVSSRPAATMK